MSCPGSGEHVAEYLVVEAAPGQESMRCLLLIEASGAKPPTSKPRVVPGRRCAPPGMTTKEGAKAEERGARLVKVELRCRAKRGH